MMTYTSTLFEEVSLAREKGMKDPKQIASHIVNKLKDMQDAKLLLGDNLVFFKNGKIFWAGDPDDYHMGLNDLEPMTLEDLEQQIYMWLTF